MIFVNIFTFLLRFSYERAACAIFDTVLLEKRAMCVDISGKGWYTVCDNPCREAVYTPERSVLSDNLSPHMSVTRGNSCTEA